MPGIGIIANPNSRRNKRNPRLIQRLGYVLGDRGTLATTHSVDDIYRVAEEFKRRQIDILCLNGGDGTNHCTITAFIKVYGDTPLPRLALLCGGTMNTVAADCGIRGAPAQLLFNVVDKYHNGLPFEEVRRTTMKVGEDYGFLFGNGIVSSFLEAYYEGGDASPWKAVTTLSRAIASATVQGDFIRRLLSRVEAEVTVDDQTWPTTAWDTITAGTVAHVGLGFKPYFRALEQPGFIHLLGIACGPMRVVRQLPNIYRARATTDPDIQSVVAKHIRITARKPFAYQVDGDIHTSQSDLQIDAGPEVTIIKG